MASVANINVTLEDGSFGVLVATITDEAVEWSFERTPMSPPLAGNAFPEPEEVSS